MACNVSFHATLVLPDWEWSILIHSPYRFTITGYYLYCFTLCFISLALQGMVEIASRDPLLVFPNWACFILFHFCFTGSSLLGIVCIVSPHDLLVLPYWVWFAIVSFHASLVLHYWVWRVLFHFPHLVFIPGHGVYCFMSSFIGSSLLGIDHIASFHDSLVLPYRAWFE